MTRPTTSPPGRRQSVCELLVMIHGKPLSGDAFVDAQRHMRGDVIAALPDGHPWSHEERVHPRWVIVKVPDMTLAEGEALAAHEPTDGTHRPLRLRLFHLDHPGLPRGDHTVEAISLTAAEVRGARRHKAPVSHPDVIGDTSHPSVIG